MRSIERSPLARLQVLFPLLAAGLWLSGGCATKGDLESLKQEIEASSAAKVESLKGETKSGFEATRKQIEEREKQLAQDLKAQQEALAKLTESLKSEQARLADLSAKLDALSKDQAEVHSAVKTSTQMLRDFLKTEEARLQASLNAVQGMLKSAASDDKPKEAKPVH
ncbi:MAG: hypothetical protein AB1411_02810 [Nitrospirota bacterium]